MSSTGLEQAYPSWLPPRIQRATDQLALAGLVPASIVYRFATDARMEDVWRELDKRTRDSYRPTSVPFYPATLPPQCESWAALAVYLREHAAKERSLGRDTKAEELEQLASLAARLDRVGVAFDPPPHMRHEMALAALFVTAIARFWQQPETATLKELDERVAAEREAGRADVARAFEGLLDDPGARRFIVARRRTDARLEAYVEAMTIECRNLFGHDLPGIVATLTNVAFERNDITRDRVRALTKVRQLKKSA